MVKVYHRLDLETGITTWWHFTNGHFAELNNGECDEREQQPLERVQALELVNKWNHSSRFKYWIT